MAFLDVSFPRQVAAGVSGGPERRVDVVALSSGDEERNARWLHSRRSWDAGVGVRDADDLAAVVALFEQAGGMLHSFRFRDWSDFTSAAVPSAAITAQDQRIGTGDGLLTQFQLAKRYGGLLPYDRPITKPVPGSVLVSVNGAVVASGWSVNHLTGAVTFLSPPAAGAAIRAGFAFDVPARFDTQRIAVQMAFYSEDESRGVGSIPDIPLIEVKE